jgi:hypothetical protein
MMLQYYPGRKQHKLIHITKSIIEDDGNVKIYHKKPNRDIWVKYVGATQLSLLRKN